MSRNIKPFGLRLPDKLKDELRLQAKKNKRSLNAEITLLLEKSLNSSSGIKE